jgi:BCD family chlorophyll transporter-like MFS transporter
MTQNLVAGIALAVLAFCLIGVGVGAAGTTLLVLLAKRTAPSRRAAAATIVWTMMIAGFIVTAGVGGRFLDPFSPTRLVAVTAIVCVLAFVITVLAVWNMDGPAERAAPPAAAATRFGDALREVWGEPRSRRFAIFVFISMLAYSAQDLILEPFAGAVLGYTLGESTQLSSLQNGGVLAGMLLVALALSGVGGRWGGTMQGWAIGGCIASALALLSLVAAGLVGPAWPLRVSVFALGLANGAYAVAAIGSMMGLVGAGAESREGVRMGVWGAAQALAFGLGGFLGTASVDAARWFFGVPATAYVIVFAAEAALFVLAAFLAARVAGPRVVTEQVPAGGALVAG